MSDKHPSPERNMEVSPGHYLLKLRREKQLSVEEVSEATKISIKNIRAIEQASFDLLPADTFVRGLVTLYGNYLGIDGRKIAAELLAERKKHSTGSRPQNLAMKTIPPSTLAPKKLAEPSHISSATVALLLFAAIVISFTGFCLYTSWNPFAFLSKQTSSMQVSIQKMFGGDEAQQQQTAGQNTPTNTDTGGGEDTISGGSPQAGVRTESDIFSADEQAEYPYRLTAHFIEDCTVTVSVDGTEPIKKRYTSGQTEHWQARQELKITFDTPKSATLSLNDAPLSFPISEDGRPPSLLLPDDVFDHQ
ncbi:MAG TPA: helix-turn-helix domain-containing protein [Desulfobulbaceae bacterium]|nr:helix-turn-helix domain-containing protein [Desulfobulbaceae bacterium]